MVERSFSTVETLIGTAALVAVKVGARPRGVRIIPDRLRPACGSTASLPTPRGARLHWRETIPRPALLR